MRHIIEKSGVCAHKGMLQVRYDVYLDPGDPFYDQYFIEKPIIPEDMQAMYDARFAAVQDDEQALAVLLQEYDQYIQSLFMAPVQIPCHGHFCYFDPDVTDEELAYIGDVIVDLVSAQWDGETRPVIRNLPVEFQTEIDEYRAAALAARVEEIVNGA